MVRKEVSERKDGWEKEKKRIRVEGEMKQRTNKGEGKQGRKETMEGERRLGVGSRK